MKLQQSPMSLNQWCVSPRQVSTKLFVSRTMGVAMPETTTTVRWATVPLPEGGWGQVKIVRADGFKPWRMSMGSGAIVLVAYFTYRLFLRLRWWLDRDRRCEVRIYRIPGDRR